MVRQNLFTPAPMPPQIDTSGYTIQSVDYYKRALACYDAVPHTGNVSLLFYSALEARNGIERLLYEYLVVFGHRQWNPRWERGGLYRPADLKRHILDVEPEFDRKLQFTGSRKRERRGGRVPYRPQ